jgi:hypothetical protein
VTSQEVE